MTSLLTKQTISKLLNKCPIIGRCSPPHPIVHGHLLSNWDDLPSKLYHIRVNESMSTNQYLYKTGFQMGQLDFIMSKSFFKWAILGLFLFIFGPFKQTIQILQQINVKNVHLVCSTGIRTYNHLIVSLLLYPPSRPGLPPVVQVLCTTMRGLMRGGKCLFI